MSRRVPWAGVATSPQGSASSKASASWASANVPRASARPSRALSSAIARRSPVSSASFWSCGAGAAPWPPRALARGLKLQPSGIRSERTEGRQGAAEVADLTTNHVLELGLKHRLG